MIELAKINTVSGTQARTKLDQSVIAEYAAAYKSGVKMPPVTLFFDGSTYFLADGFHRVSGARDAGVKKIHEEVIPGTLREAILYSLKANETHGLRRTNADKRKAVETLLADPEWATWSVRDIAAAASVSPSYAAEIKNLTVHVDSEKATEYTTKHGTTATMKTANIGKKPEVEKAENKEPEYKPADDELAEAQNTVTTLAAEVDALKDRLAAGAIVGTEEEKTAAIDTMCSLRSEITRLEIENRALVDSRNSYQRENTALKKQCEMHRKQIAKLQKEAA